MFEIGDRVRVLTENAYGATVRRGALGTVRGIDSEDDYEVLMDAADWGAWPCSRNEQYWCFRDTDIERVDAKGADGFALLDSGEREDFSTGSKRDTREGKGRYDLISPVAERRLAVVLERGAAKYGDRNWEKGQPLCRFLDSAKRHIGAVLEGKADEDHAAQAMWNLMAFIHIQEAVTAGTLPAELNDLPGSS